MTSKDKQEKQKEVSQNNAQAVLKCIRELFHNDEHY